MDLFMAYIIKRLTKKPFWNMVSLLKTWQTHTTTFRIFKATTDAAPLELVRIQDRKLTSHLFIPEEDILHTRIIGDLVLVTR